MLAKAGYWDSVNDQMNTPRKVAILSLIKSLLCI